MLKIFERFRNSTKGVVLGFKGITVEEIHEAFDTASDHTLDLANKILAKEVSSEFDEYNKLERLGFSGVPAVQETVVIKNNLNRTKNQINAIQKMGVAYPNYKFILNEDLDELIKRFGLLLGESKDYIGNIPSQNRKDILNFIPTSVVVQRQGSRGNSWFKSYYTKKDFSDRDWNHMLEGGYSYKEGSETYRIQKEFKIVAPASMFKLEGKQIVDGKIQDIPKPMADDPVVLFVVDDGYIIVSKWGPEAEIAEFQKGSEY